MNLGRIRILHVVFWTVLFSCLGFLSLEGVQRTDWYQQRLYRQLTSGSEPQRWAAAMGLARVGAETMLLQGLRSDEPATRDPAQRALEHLWFISSGLKAYKITERAHESLEQEHYAEALELLDTLVRRYPTYAEGWNRRASLYWRIGEYEKSIADCQRVLELNPNHYGAWQGIGVCQLQLGQVAEACHSLRAALRILPHDEATRRSLSKCEELLRLYPSPQETEPFSQLL